MDRRCAAGALLALAACIATTAAAPTASNQTALDLYEGPSEGCYYNFQHYGEGDRIMTNEPCLNCTCHNRMLMCYLRVCPFTKPIGQDCSVEKRADQCCPIVTCPDVPVDLLTSTSTSSPSEYGETGLGKLDRYGCSINGKYFPEGAKVPPSPNKPCEHCYCIRNMTTCVMQECTLHVDGCTPIYRKDVCCPVRYSCDHPEDEIPLLDDMTTTVRPTPGFLLTTTTLAPVTQMTQDCVHDDKVFADGALIKTEKACEHCYCMKGDIVCVVQECGTPMENEGKNCTSMPPREGQCCPDTYICEGDEMTTEANPDVATLTPFEDITTLSPPRRVSVEGSGYRSETDEPSTEVSPLESDVEGSGEDQPFKPTDANDMLIPESETPPPFIVTDQDEIEDHYSPGTTEVPESEPKITEKTTTEADKGENTVPSGDFEEDTSDKTSTKAETTTTKVEADKESSYDAKTTVLPEHQTSLKDKTTPLEDIAVTEPAIIVESTIADHELLTSPVSIDTSEDQGAETTKPTRRKEDEEVLPKETTTLEYLEEATTKPSDIIVPDIIVTESTTSPFVEQEVKTTTAQLTETDKELTTESRVELTTEIDVKTDTQSATTIQPEIGTDFTTPSKVDFSDTTSTSANPIENEIDEEPFPTLAPGRIPGEGDCLLDGVTYSHESIVPSSSNCHTSCKCVSSIVKCEPIVCSPPPDYMDNCQPMYDSPESCCPTYVCDHPRETVPPQSHSQMAGTESPISTPTIECDGDQCKIIKEKEETKPSIPCTSEGCTDDSNKKPDECGPQGCGEIVNKPEEDARPFEPPTEECNGDSCSLSPEHCTSGKCEAIPKDQTCNNENGCEIPIVQTCQGDDCAIQHEVTPSKDDSTPCDDPSGCKIPVIETCQGQDCAIQPDITASKDDSATCDNPDDCKNVQIPEKAPHCKGESCISELPPQIPQESQESKDCQDGSNCGEPNETPTIAECNEEECKSQQVPDINKPPPDDCFGTQCTQQQDHIPQVTDVPELATESAPRVTELPGEPETKSEEPITDLPKTTAIEIENEPSATTKAPISDMEEEPVTTQKYDDLDKNKEKETTSIITESPETVTQMTERQQDESITEGAKTETTLAPIQDITKVSDAMPEATPAHSEAPTTEIPSLSDKDTMEITTKLPSFVESESPEPTIKPMIESHTEVTENVAKDKDSFDITTTEAGILSSSPEIHQETTKSPEMLTLAPESLDRDGHERPTKEPEYVQDTEEKVTDSTERYTPAPEQITDKVDVEPIEEQQPESMPTTPKSFESQTVAPEVLETESPEAQTTLTQDEDIKSPELPVSTSSPEETITGEPDDSRLTAGEAETKAPEFVTEKATISPDVPLDLGNKTPQPELYVTPGEELMTKVPITGETESQTEESKPLVTLPHEMPIEESGLDRNAETPPPVIVDVQTETPMSIVKDHGDDEVGSTVTPESAVTTERITSKPESPEPTAMPAKTESEEPVSDIEKKPSISDEEHTATEPSADGSLPTKQPVEDSGKTTIPETETSTDFIPVSVPIVNEPISSEASVTEANLQETSAPQEEASDYNETKSPTSVTESSVQAITDEGEIVTPAQKQSDDNEDVTELPELIVHEHPTEPSSIEKESEQTPTEDTITKEPQETRPDKETTDALAPQDYVTVTPEIPERVSQKETTGKPDQESATKAPEFLQPETTESKLDDEISHIAETSTTEPLKEVTEDHGSLATPSTSEGSDMDTQKEEVEIPVTQGTVTSTPKVSETEPQEIITESQVTVTETDLLVTHPHEDTTDAAISSDMVTNPSESSDATSEPHKESPAMPEEPEVQSHTETTKTQDAITTIPEISPTESHKESTESPKLEDTATTVAAVSPDTLDKEASIEPKPQEAVTTTPEVFATEPQDEFTKAPEVTGMAANVPDTTETVLQEKATEGPVAQEVITSAPELHITEPVPVEYTNIPVTEEKLSTLPEISVTEAPKESTETPTYDDSSSHGPEPYATEPQKEVTEAPAAEDVVTNAPETLITQSNKDTQEPESQDTPTSSPGLPETEPMKETTQEPESQDTPTSSPGLPETEPMKETTDLPESQEASSTIPDTSQTEPKKEITEIPETQDITIAPEIPSVTKHPEIVDTKSPVTNAPEAQDLHTYAPEVPTMSENEVTEIQESSEIPLTEPHKIPSKPSEVLTTESQKLATEVPEISSVTKHPEIFDTKSPVTNAPEAQDVPTFAPEVPTVSENEVTEIQESSEIPLTEPHKIPSKPSEVLTTESQKPATELPEISPAVATSAPEMLATKSDEKSTESPDQELTTKATESVETEPEPEKSFVTEKDESITEPPLKITTKFDDHTQADAQEFITTEPSRIESDTSFTTEGGSPIEPDTKVTESLATEYPIKIPDLDTDTEKPAPSVTAAEEKPDEGQEIKTEIPYVEPTQTESAVSESVEPETKAPELIDIGSGATVTPELPLTEKQDSNLTEATSAPVEENVTKAPETLETEDETTKIFEEPEQTTKAPYPETTPEAVLLEEHTHKTVSPDEEASASPSDIPLKEYEPSTPEVSIDKVTESTPSTESDKTLQEDVLLDKDHYVPELTPTTIPEKSTEPSLVSGEITTSSPLPGTFDTEKPQSVESNEISTSAPTTGEQPIETEKPLVPSVESELDKETTSSEKPQETIAPEDEFILATTKATTIKVEDEHTTLSPLLDKYGKPDDEAQKPAAESEKPKPDVTEEVSKPGANEVQPTEEALPEEEGHFPPSETSGYGQEPADYGEEDSFGPGTCRYGGKVYVSAQQIPRDDPCDFCFCFRSDIICLQQSCPPPIHGCHEEPIQGFCCPRYECPVSMATTLNVTTTTTTTTTTLPPHFLPHAYKGAAQRRGCQIKGHTYKVGEVVRASSGPCLHCTCGGDGQMKCDPKVCTPEPMLRQMIAAAVSAKRRR